MMWERIAYREADELEKSIDKIRMIIGVEDMSDGMLEGFANCKKRIARIKEYLYRIINEREEEELFKGGEG